jgi:uncharacterized protein (DUF1697 family)
MKVAFLRAINVSGKNKIKMDDLKSIYIELGLKDVSTYLNTGNVGYNGEVNVNTIEEAIFKETDLEIHVIIKELDEMNDMIQNLEIYGSEKNCYVTMFKSNIPNISDDINRFKQPDDEYHIQDDYLTFFVPGGYGKSKLNNNLFEKKAHVHGTTRNLKTMKNVKKMMEETR